MANTHHSPAKHDHSPRRQAARWLLVLSAALAFGQPLHAGDGSIDPATGEMEFQVNFRYPPNPQQITNAKLALTKMSQMICDATDAQIRVSEVRLTGGAAEEDRAAFWYFSEGFRSGGSIFLDGSSLTTLGSRLNLSSGAQFRGAVLAHEMGHHAFGLGEQYDEQRRWGGACGIGRGFESPALDEQNNSLMQQAGTLRCVGGADDGSSCRWDSECDSESCQPVLMSEFSVAANHDQVRGDNVMCPGGPITSIEFGGSLPESAPIQTFDGADWGTAQAAASTWVEVEAIDSMGQLPAARLTFFATRTAASTWQISAAVDDGIVGGTDGDLNLLEQWTLDFNGDGSLNSVSESPPDLQVTGLANGAADLDIDLDFGTPDPGDTPGSGEDGILNPALGATFLSESHDGFPICTAADCADRWNTGTSRWESTHQSLWHDFESDWETLEDNYPFITPPAGLPDAAPPGACLAAPAYVEDVVGVDQVLLIMDRSYSMSRSSRDGLDEVCDNGSDDDSDGTVDEGDCAESRIEFVQSAARAFVDLQVDAGLDVGLMEFNHDNDIVRQIDPLDSTNIADFKIDIDDLSPAGNTSIGSAMEDSLAEFARVATAGRSQTAFLLTDGYNTTGPDPSSKIQDVRDAGVRVFTIPAGSAADVEGVSEIAVGTGGQMIAADSADELPAVYAELAAHYGGAGLVLPRTHFALDRKAQERDDAGPKVTTHRVFPLPVEKGADSLVAFVSGRNGRMATWQLGLELIGPSGQRFDTTSPEFTSDPYYAFFRVPNPEAGTWSLRALPGAPGLQESIAMAFVANAEPRFFADVRPRTTSISNPVTISASPIWSVDIEGDTSIEGVVTRPDGSTVPVVLKKPSPMQTWRATFDDYVGRGLYRAQLRLDVGPDARPFRGEPIFEGPERFPIDVAPFQRTRTVHFFVRDGDFPPCDGPDCDNDGIPDDRECGTDTDKDGIPNTRDTDSDNDEMPDSMEGLKDRDGNGVPDACDPQRPPDPPRRPDIPSIMELEKKAIAQVCQRRYREAEASLTHSIKWLERTVKRSYDKRAGWLEQVLELKWKALKLIRSNRLSCDEARELLGKALAIEAEASSRDRPRQEAGR